MQKESAEEEKVGEYVLVLSATISELDRPRFEAIIARLRELTLF